MKSKILKISMFSSLIIILSCNMVEKPLTLKEKDNIKEELITTYMDHVEDLMSLDYKEMMKFYPKEHILYGDGKYWGDYNTTDEIWKGFTSGVKEMIKWDVDNHKIFVHNKNAASYLVEFVNWRVEGTGDTTKVDGSFSFGMQRYPDGWKAATVNVTHNYTAGPWVKK